MQQQSLAGIAVTMKRPPFLPILILCLCLCAAHRSEGMQAMTDTDLASCTGQAGMDMAVADLVVYHHQESISFSGSANQPLTLGSTKSLFTLNAGIRDINGNGKIDPVTLDIGMLSDLERLWKEPNWLPENEWQPVTPLPANVLDRPVLALRAPDWDRNLEIRNSGISLNGTTLGSFSLQGNKTLGWELFLAAGRIFTGNDTRKSGMDLEFAFQKQIDALTYAPSTSQTLCLENILLTKDLTFSEDMSSEITASGFFRLGDMRQGKPLSIDMGVTDAGRSEPTPVLRMNLRDAAGSFAIASIQDTESAATRDFGPLIAQGIKIHHMVIEFPGRNFP